VKRLADFSSAVLPEFIKAGSRRGRHEEAVHSDRCNSDASSHRFAGSADGIYHLPIDIDVRAVFDVLLLCGDSSNSHLRGGVSITLFLAP
jgi:hypothetical protein